MAEFRAPKGMLDILPPDSARWELLLAAFAGLAGRAGFGLAVTPVIEHIEVFLRLGDSSDVVRKEMYDFEDKGGRRIAVRPELTASLMRAFVEHHPLTPWKAWTVGPNFRYERPQAGRYRQHFQLDAEIVGTHDPEADVEVIALLDGFHRALGLQQRTLFLNSLGDATCRPAYRTALLAYFRDHLGDLTEESRTTLELNPLRVLDSKREVEQGLIDGAPKMVDFLSDEAGIHFETVGKGLKALDIEFTLNNRLVRGFDYYTDTIFEFASHALPGSQNAIGGGGRYNGLVEQLGGPAGTGGVGFGAGIERILLACDAEASFPAPAAAIDVYIVDTTGQQQALVIAHELRSAGLRVDRAFDGRSMKSQMKTADRSGAQFAVIVGTDELAAGTATIKPMRGGDQVVTDRATLPTYLRNLLS
jgi:histidyl-tRNA synthetase